MGALGGRSPLSAGGRAGWGLSRAWAGRTGQQRACSRGSQRGHRGSAGTQPGHVQEGLEVTMGTGEGTGPQSPQGYTPPRGSRAPERQAARAGRGRKCLSVPSLPSCSDRLSPLATKQPSRRPAPPTGGRLSPSTWGSSFPQDSYHSISRVLLAGEEGEAQGGDPKGEAAQPGQARCHPPGIPQPCCRPCCLLPWRTEPVPLERPPWGQPPRLQETVSVRAGPASVTD